DYNSSEFTVYHLKTMIRVIAENPDVKKVNIVAHSRGTDVTLNALRELHLEISGSGRSTREVLKMGTGVLAAPDIDIDVMFQRAATARLGQIPEQAVVYVCPKDEALGFSRFLFSGMRLGKIEPGVFTPEELDVVRKGKSPSIVNAAVTKPGDYGHNYFYSNPAVSSDLILVLRYHFAPGPENGRPLSQDDGGFWTIKDDYPTSVPKQLLGPQTPTTRPR
ncbi:MAG: alpha/beta hydrolase, partial [Tepidisphaeraceae bacterium]